MTVANTVKALSAFERVLISGTSPFDRDRNGDATAISDAARRGSDLFNAEKLECFHCHGGFNLQDVTRDVGHASVEARFHSAAERAALHAFFDSLTDDAFLTDVRFANPWPP